MLAIIVTMKCCDPLLAYRVPSDTRLKLVGRFVDLEYWLKAHPDLDKVLLPCGKCLPCRMSRAKDWTIRNSHELRMSDYVCSFVTLTYDDAHLPIGGSLCKRDYQLFLKRLRKCLDGKKIRYFGCGEYGSKSLRPHYHFLIYGLDLSSDRVLHDSVFSVNSPIYRSALIEKCWPLGISSVSDVTDGVISYVCRYQLKKQQQVLPDDLVKPFVCCSSRPGIGLRWFERFRGDLLSYDSDGNLLRCSYISHGVTMSVPRYYKKKLENESENMHSDLQNLNNDYIMKCPRGASYYRARERYVRARERSYLTDNIDHTKI